MTDVLGQEAYGRYVIVQMDNGGDPLNLQEVKTFGRRKKYSSTITGRGHLLDFITSI